MTAAEAQAERDAAFAAADSSSSASTSAAPGAARLAAASYDRAAARTYAYTYWNSHHPSFPLYDEDCTNFVSQVIHAGGFPYTSTATLTNTNYWWKTGSGSSAKESTSFMRVHDFYAYTVDSSRRGARVAHSTALTVGDVIQVSWNTSTDDDYDVLDHTMVVTKLGYTSTGALRVYVTYHSNNRKDKSFTQLKADFPKARWVFIAMRDQV